MHISAAFVLGFHEDIEELLFGLISRTLYACPRFILFEALDLQACLKASQLVGERGMDYQIGAGTTVPWSLRVGLPSL